MGRQVKNDQLEKKRVSLSALQTPSIVLSAPLSNIHFHSLMYEHNSVKFGLQTQWGTFHSITVVSGN